MPPQSDSAGPARGSSEAETPPGGGAGASSSKGEKKRVSRACDNCRIRKSKCDGFRPCSLCRLHSVDCSYDSVRKSKRRDLNYIMELEKTVERLTGLLEERGRRESESSRHPSAPSTAGSTPNPREQAAARPADDTTKLETIIGSTGQLAVDDFGNYEFHGSYAGLTILQRISDLCNALIEGQANQRHNPASAWISGNQPFGPLVSRSLAPALSHAHEMLPDKLTATRLVIIAFSQAFPLLRFIDQNEFDVEFNRLYSVLDKGGTIANRRYIAFVFVVLAIGELYSVRTAETAEGAKASHRRAEEYYLTGHNTLDLMDCRDLTSVQVILCIIIYLQSCAMISTCYSYISLALSACSRMGLHRSSAIQTFSIEEQEKRRRIFWVLRTMASYVTTMLGLPRTLGDEEVDQELPADVNVHSTLPFRKSAQSSTMSFDAVNAHIRLHLILDRIRTSIHGGNKAQEMRNGVYYVNFAHIAEVEQELAAWFSKLPAPVQGPVSPEFEKEQLLLRLFYAHVQMALYRPFLHHIAKDKHDPGFDFHAYACASSCIRASMQVIWLDKTLKARGYLNGHYWFTVYTNFSAVVCLLMFNLSNRADPTAMDALSTAMEGFGILKEMAVYNFAAARCVECLVPIFEKIVDNKSALYLNESGALGAPPQVFQRGPIPVYEPSSSRYVSPVINESPSGRPEMQAVAYAPMYPFLDEVGQSPMSREAAAPASDHDFLPLHLGGMQDEVE